LLFVPLFLEVPLTPPLSLTSRPSFLSVLVLYWYRRLRCTSLPSLDFSQVSRQPINPFFLLSSMSTPSSTPREYIVDAVPNAPFYQPLTEPSPGTALSAEDWSQNKVSCLSVFFSCNDLLSVCALQDLPLLFQPLKVGPITLKNRIIVSYVSFVVFSS
jgi:hypothetical protein